MKKTFTLYFLLLISTCTPDKKTPISPPMQDLQSHINDTFFERDTLPYYINVFQQKETQKSYATLVDFRNQDTVLFFKKEQDKWQPILGMKNDFGRLWDIKHQRFDANFDGYEDIAYRYAVSNGCACEYYHLFLYNPDNKSFKYAPTFSELGCAKVHPVEKIISTNIGYSACTEYDISEYAWEGQDLKLVKELHRRRDEMDSLEVEYYLE